MPHHTFSAFEHALATELHRNQLPPTPENLKTILHATYEYSNDYLDTPGFQTAFDLLLTAVTEAYTYLETTPNTEAA